MANVDIPADSAKTAKIDPDEDAVTNNLFVGNLSYYSTADRIRKHFAQFGRVRDVRLPMARSGSQKGRRYCFLTFSNEASARSALADTTHQLDGKKLVVRPASNRPDSSANTETFNKSKEMAARIFVGGIGQEIDSQSLTTHFSTFGKVLSVEILFDHKTKRNRGFAFVEFAGKSSADLACGEKYQMLGNKRVEVKPAEPKAAKIASEVAATSVYAASVFDNQASEKAILDQWVSSIKTFQYYSSMLSQQYRQQQQCYGPAPTPAAFRYSPYLLPVQNQQSFGLVPSSHLPAPVPLSYGAADSQAHLAGPPLGPGRHGQPVLVQRTQQSFMMVVLEA